MQRDPNIRWKKYYQHIQCDYDIYDLDDMYADQLLTVRQTAKMLMIAEPTLYAMRKPGKDGPPFVRFGGCVRYRARDLAAWIEKQVIYNDGKIPE